MTNEEKRQILYAALLRYSPEVGPLRERVLDRIVLVALLESSHSNPMRLRQIQRLTRADPRSPGLRRDVIEETLSRLMSRTKVEHVRHNTGSAYCLTNAGRDDTDEAAASAYQLFQPVLARMLRDTATVCDEHDAVVVCRSFVSECFARFGQQIAKAVTGEFTKDQLVGTVDVNGAFQAAIRKVSLSDDAIESLKARCIRFLRSTEPDDEELKFRLTQGYYVAQLLGLDPYKFNPLAEDAFREAVFYVDTNVLIGKLLSGNIARLFDELARICRALGVELRVSRATINEARSVAVACLEGLENALAKMPSELLNRTQDDFLDAFLEEREIRPGLTAEEFLRRFDEIPSLLEQLEITLYDHTAEEIIGDLDVTRECEIVSCGRPGNPRFG